VPTVIDSLIVKLGLDPRDFTKGQKAAAKSQLELEQGTKNSVERQSNYLGKLSAKWLTVTGAIMAAKKAVSIIDDVAERTRRLGIDSKNYNMAAAEMRNFENAVEMMGGTAEEARKSLAGFNQSIFNLAYNGQMSDSLVMLARLGVQFQTATGQARNFEDVVLDTADAIGKAQKQGMTRQDAYQYLQQAGFDQGTAQLILSGRANAEAQLTHQRERRQVSGTDIDAATGISTSRTGRRQAREGLEVEFMQSKAGKVVEAANQKLEELMTPSGAAEALGNLADKAKHLGDIFDNWTLSVGGATRGLRNNNPGNLRAVGDQNRDRLGFKVNRTMAEGIQDADHQLDLYAKRGVKTLKQIVSTWAPPGENDTKKYIADMVKETGYGEDDEIDSGKRAIFLAAMFKRESGKGAPDAGAVADVLTFQGDTAGPTMGGPGAPATPSAQGAPTSQVTNVDIDSITVNTQAKDATKMAADLDGAIKRKLLSAHAETGMN
jgi:hypothetical protein